MTAGKRPWIGPKVGKINYPLSGVMAKDALKYDLLHGSYLLYKNPRSKNIIRYDEKY